MLKVKMSGTTLDSYSEIKVGDLFMLNSELYMKCSTGSSVCIATGLMTTIEMTAEVICKSFRYRLKTLYVSDNDLPVPVFAKLKTLPRGLLAFIDGVCCMKTDTGLVKMVKPERGEFVQSDAEFVELADLEMEVYDA